VLGTIEPRKNHLLLLTLWRELAKRHGVNTPQLVVIGRRGWECEQVVDLLERCEAIHPHLVEINDASDEQVVNLLAGARALLMPSYAEGFGMPVQEALALGTPVISSPLPAIKEFAGDIPDYAEPHDGTRWLELIEAYAQSPSLQREAQVQRLKNFRHTTWQEHFQKVEEFMESEVRGQRSEVRGQRSEVRGQRSEVRRQKTEDRSQKSEVRGQRTEDRMQREL
jgi:glycosyltransferase involved in cell wall biosynthesis